MRKLLAFAAFMAAFLAVASAQKNTGNTGPTSEVLNFADSIHHYEKMPEFGVFLGLAHYEGELTNYTLDIDFSHNMTPAVGVFYRKNFSPSFAWRANALFSKISDADQNYTAPDWRDQRRFSFESMVTDLSLRLEWDVLGRWRYRRAVDTSVYTLDKHTQYALVERMKPTLSPYIYVGGGGLAVSAKPTMIFVMPDEKFAHLIKEDQEKAKSMMFIPSVCVGGGAHFDLGPRVVLSGEVTAHLSKSDYLDGISKAGNPKTYDWLFTGGITLSFRLGHSDRDKDGVPNERDKCPDIPGYFGTKGCPDIDHDDVSDREDDCPHKKGIRAMAGCPIKDADEDGVPDIDDQCPTVAGLSQFLGCPDTDKDGIEDKLDSCKTVAGVPNFNGCPDTDSDGIEDKLDACPTEAGPAEYYYGCPVRDTDGDGIEDKLDACLLVKGAAEFKGCPDTDKDGVEDKADPCPNIAGPKENRGCPVVEKKDKEKLQLAVKAVKFETGKAVLKPESSKVLTDMADILKRYPSYLLKIEGHTDNQGKDEANMALSEKRAQACADFLATKGIEKTRFRVKGFGKTKPVADNKTAAGRTQNRRVEFELTLPE